MKKFNLTVLFLLFPFLFYSQLATFDASVSAAVNVTNLNITQTNITLNNILSELRKMNAKLDNQGRTLTKSLKIETEENQAKKTPANFVTNSGVAKETLKLKNKIVSAFKETKNNVEQLKYVSDKDVASFLIYHGKKLVKATKIISDANQIMYTNSILPSDERLKILNGFNETLEKILDDIIRYNRKLTEINNLRFSKETIINMSKPGL